MSKASDYADTLRQAILTQPQALESKEGMNMARVEKSGSLSLYPGTFTAVDAMRLRDWLTENYGEEPVDVTPRRWDAPGVGPADQTRPYPPQGEKQ